MNLRITFYTLLAAFSLTAAQAADLQVTENGQGGGYTSIMAAHAAANDGDRIVIHAKAGNAPWNEDLTITKSLVLMPAIAGTYWRLNGDVTVTPSAAGKVITLSRLEATTGYVRSFANAPTGTRTRVNILGCKIDGPYVYFDYNNFDVTIAGCVMSNTYNTIRFGRVIGNDITNASANNAIRINQDGTASNDTILVVGNKVLQSNTTVAAMTWYNTNQYAFIANNSIIKNGANYNGLYIDGNKSTGTGANTIINNTFRRTTAGSFNGYGIYLANATTNLSVLNNLFIASTGGTAINRVGGTTLFTCSYNIATGTMTMSGITNDGTNIMTGGVNTVDADQRPQSGSTAINGGHPGDEYSDLDLSRNNAGSYGGSYTLDNFFPQSASGPQVIYSIAPRRVVVGSQIQLKAAGITR